MLDFAWGSYLDCNLPATVDAWDNLLLEGY